MKAALQEDASSGDGHRAQERTHARGTRTIQKLDYRHPMSSKVDFSASVNMLRGLSQIFFLLLLFGKLRPVSIEPNAFCFSHDMILNWRLVESSFGGEEVETNTDARTHAHTRVLVARCASPPRKRCVLPIYAAGGLVIGRDRAFL